MERCHKSLWLARTSVPALLLAATIGRGLAASQPVAGSPCLPGTYVVKGRSLLPSDMERGNDAVVLEIAGDAEGTPPLVTVRSGCAAGPATLASKQNHTVVTAELSACGAVEATARLRARIDASCQTMRGRFRARHAGKGSTVRRFAARRGAVAGARVTGRVSARHGEQSFSLPGVAVVLRGTVGRPSSPRAVETDAAGRFVLDDQAAGTYEVCAAADGFEPACAPEAVELRPTGSAYRDVELTPIGGAVHGRVLLADGSRCYEPPTSLDGGVAASVSQVGAQRRARADVSGTYLLTGLSDPGTYTLQATCGGSSSGTSVSVGDQQLSGAEAIDLTVPNSPPTISLLAASTGGVGVRSAAPGTTLDVTAEVDDVDGDRLHYVWLDDQGGVTPVDAPTARWTLQPVPASNVLVLLVSDGKGGYARQQLVVRGGEPVARFAGHVKARGGAALVNAKVSVGGATGTTDDTGFFRLDVPESARYVLTVKAPGHAPYSQAFDAEMVGIEIEIAPARRYVVDATDAFEVQDGPNGHRLRFPAGALVDADGNPPTGALNVDVYTYDQNRGEFPGDRVAEAADGSLHGLTLETCLWLAVTDASGKRFHLAPESHVDVSFAIPDPIVADPPEMLTLMRFDEASGRWVEDGSAVRVDDRYQAQVATLAPIGVSIFPDQGNSCLRIDVDDNQLERPFRLRVDSGIVNVTTVADIFIQEKTSVIYGLSPGSFYSLHIRPLSNAAKVIRSVTVLTGPNTFPPNPAYPYSPCKPVKLTTKLPTTHWLDEIGVGTEESALDYYARTGAIPSRDTFQKWLTANGFESGYAANDVVFFNQNELGLARRLNCRQHTVGFVQVVGCFVTKYGEVGGNPDAMLQDAIDRVAPGDTVAMEFSPGGLRTERNTKFYIYGPDGKLKTKTAFDTEGYTKYVAVTCEHCHPFRSNDDGTGVADPNDQFVTLDPFEYKFPASGPYTLENQQERFRQLNEMISYAERHSGAGWELMDSIYPRTSSGGFGVHVPGTKARPQPVPNAWRDEPEVWSKIVKPSCRTCHMHMRDDFDWDSSKDLFLPYGAELVCSGRMPNAMAPMLRLWRTSDPFLPDVFSDTYGMARCIDHGRNDPPVVTIISPSDNHHIPYGGVNGLKFTASATDPQDGSLCCSIDWLDEAGTIVGHGKEITRVFPKPGVTKLRAVARDYDGTPSRADEVTVFADNVTPTLAINSPLASGTFYRFVPYSLLATIFDPNRDASCDNVVWETDFTSPKKGCEPFPLAFQTLGQHTLTVHVTDAFGATATQTRTVNVVESPPHSLPVVAIFAPASGAVLNPNVATELGATLGDPDIDDCAFDADHCAGFKYPTYKWSVRFGATFEKEVSINPDKNGHFLFTPVNTKGLTGCGPTPVDLVFKATDSDGTTVAIRRVTVAFPAC